MTPLFSHPLRSGSTGAGLGGGVGVQRTQGASQPMRSPECPDAHSVMWAMCFALRIPHPDWMGILYMCAFAELSRATLRHLGAHVLQRGAVHCRRYLQLLLCVHAGQHDFEADHGSYADPRLQHQGPLVS